MNISSQSLSAWNLNLFVIFEAVMAEGSVSRAGQRLGLSQPAVSHALAQLRAQLQDPLFVRTPAGMTPTARALALVVPIKEALALMVRAVSPAQFEPGRAQDMFTIAATDFAEYVLLPKLLARLAQVAPLVRLQLRSWPHHRVPPFLQAGEVDVALGFFDETPAGHHKLPLFDDHFVGVISKHHSQVASRLTLARYLKLKHIIVTADPHARGVIDDVLLKQGKQREIGLRLSHFLMVPPVVAATEMVAALSYRVAEPMQAHLALHVFPLPLEVPRGKVSLVWHERTSDAPAQKWFRSQIKLVSEQV